jgi:hypothetical protein
VWCQNMHWVCAFARIEVTRRGRLHAHIMRASCLSMSCMPVCCVSVLCVRVYVLVSVRLWV